MLSNPVVFVAGLKAVKLRSHGPIVVCWLTGRTTGVSGRSPTIVENVVLFGGFGVVTVCFCFTLLVMMTTTPRPEGRLSCSRSGQNLVLVAYRLRPRKLL